MIVDTFWEEIIHFLKAWLNLRDKLRLNEDRGSERLIVSPMLQGFLQRVRNTEAAPPWSAITALLLVFGYVVIWIAAEVIGVTVVGGDLTVPSLAGQAIGAALASVVIALVVVQWVRRSVSNWQAALHLETSHTLPLFFCLLIGLASAGRST